MRNQPKAARRSSVGVTALIASAVLVLGLVSPNFAAAMPPKSPTTTSITTSASPVTINTPVTLTATVASGTGYPGGSVDFTNGPTDLGTCTLAGVGTCSITHTWSARGEYAVVGTYTPSNYYLSSTSSPLTEVVTRYSSTTTLASSKINAFVGDNLTYTATVSGSGPTPTGGIIFYANASNDQIGTCTLSGGSCSMTATASVVGSQPIWAAYSGDDVTYLGSNSSTITEIVSAKATSTIAASGSPNPSDFGSADTITGVVSGSSGTPTGTLVFLENSTPFANCTLVNGSCSTGISSLAVGSHTITLQYGGDSMYSGSSATVVQVVNATLATTTTALTSSSNPAIVGRSVSWTMSVSSAGGTPTGRVTLQDGSTTLTICTLSSGSCTYSSSALASGTHTLTATYSGDSLFATSSTTLSQVVSTPSATATTTSLTASASDINLGTSLTFTATVTDSSAVTGTVSFQDGSNTIGSCDLSSGSCQISYSPTTVGSDTYVASFLGSSLFLPSSGSAIVNVLKRQSSLQIAASSNPSPISSGVTYFATIDPSATGVVTATQAGNQVGSCQLASGQCSMEITFEIIGSQSLVFSYSGDSNHTDTTSNFTQVVGLKSVTLTLTSDNGSADYYDTINFTATASDSTATGLVEVRDGTSVIKSCTLVQGTCTLFYYRLAVGTHSMTASYAGDSTHAGSTSALLTQIIAAAPTHTQITSLENPFSYGSGLQIAATVSDNGTGPTGTVLFEELVGGNEVSLGDCQLSGSVCVLTINAPLSVGDHNIFAEYISDGNYSGSTSASITQTITASTAAVAVVSDNSVATQGSHVTFTTSIASTGTTPTGTIQMLVDGAAVGNLITVVSGVATYTTNLLSPGSHQISAIYSGDSSTQGGTSASITEVIQYPVTVTLTSTTTSAIFPELIGFSGTVSSANGSPTGSLVLEEEISDTSEVILGTCTLSLGACTITQSQLSVGNHHIYAEYDVSGIYASGESASLVVVVSQQTPTIPSGPTPTPTPRAPRTTPAVIPTPTPVVVPFVRVGTSLALVNSPTQTLTAPFTFGEAPVKTVSAKVVVPAGAFGAPAVVTLTPQITATSVTNMLPVIQIIGTATDGKPFNVLLKPITLELPYQSNKEVPMTSVDGVHWSSIPALTSAQLPAGSAVGYFMATPKTIEIMTMHTSLFALRVPQTRLFVSVSTQSIGVGGVLGLTSTGGRGGGVVVYSTTTPQVCAVEGLTLTGLSAGICSVGAQKLGTVAYLDALSAPITIAVTP